ncbi:11723_t:CDS:2 [Ambispora leptoticha]|uniref:Dihydrolipoamide acetyltransferase component of pyruvate dehydrogenase complex n=1 Tax=Ambispora leptoticha TaxID=144679 RepID=A0A9N9F5E2_9GLOM|nr:11723_t:CDS:2 [Ambispora leptoticha]
MVKRFIDGVDKIVDVPKMAESITEGTLKKWNKKVGEFVQQDEEIATIETDKIDVPVNAPYAGKIVELYAKEEDNVEVGGKLLRIELGDAPAADTSAPATTPETPKEIKTESREEPKKEEVPTPQHAPQPTPPTQAAAPFGDREERRKYDVKIGFMSAFVKASVFALQEIPVVNATIEGPNGGDTIVYKDYVDLSVAVATPKGLVTPVLRNAHAMGSFVEIEKAIAALGQKARDGKLTIEDMAGGTFTISNGGVYGSLYGTPIINLPQSAILGMHAVKERAVAIRGQVVVRPMMYVALTYDHRLIDGREAVTFLKTIKEQVEDPRRLLLGI